MAPPDDLIEFKKYVHAELLALKALVSNRTISENSRSPREPIDYERIVIKSLEDRIISLERQLNQKQRVIEALLESRSSPPPRSGEAPTPKGPSPKQTKQNTAASNPEQKQKGQSKASGRIDVSNEGMPTGKRNNSATTIREEKQVSETIAKDKCKRVYVVGDSIVSGLSEKGLSKRHTVKVRSHPGDTTEDLADDIKPIMRKNPDLVIIHFGTNDITNNRVNTKEKLQETIDYVHEHGPDTDIAISLCILRKDKPGLQKKVSSRNNIIKEVCKKNKLKWIDNSNLDETCLGIKKLHLNKKGFSYLANNLKKFIDED